GAPRVTGDVGWMAGPGTESWRRRASRTISPASVDLPTPGEPVRPIVEARPVCPNRPEESSASPSAPSSTMEMARATARRSPARTASTRSTGQGYPPLRLGPASGPRAERGRPGTGERVGDEPGDPDLPPKHLRQDRAAIARHRIRQTE